ncbi:MAG: hypothetical protein HY391_04120 [Deltaproteobacteria bacterium]|nr:hypothetical protein [Deltaproteobacteria bacterium]
MKIRIDNEKVSVEVPTRIDLAGGTLDIWPLCSILSPVVTVNLAINLMVEAEASWRSDGKFRIEAVDLKKSREASTLQEFSNGTGLPLLSTLTAELLSLAEGETGVDIERGLTLRTHSHVPEGSGLGGSSALSIAVAVALRQLTHLNLTDEALIRIVQDVETRLLGAPTGYQDYYPPLYGGLSALRYQWGRVLRHEIPLKDKIEDRLLLFYSGQSHHSAWPNWKMLRSTIDESFSQERLVEKLGLLASFKKINSAADVCWRALKMGDWDLLAEAVAVEWEIRSRLCEGMVPPPLSKSMDAAMEAGAKALKICGAGGGGSFFALVDPGKKEEVASAVKKTGATPLHFSVY